ncbi:MAG TPA: DUF2066 domain-containing protein [Rhizomicrobium sp.]|jgi:hypothetical protein|nr:DUF2066 domain-containing protein [Rhizomicrobium sp.]
MIFRAFFLSAFALLLVAAACLTGAGPARAQDALYTVNGVHVDATGASSGEASNQAIAHGRAKAFQILFRRLTRQADWARQPPLDAASLLRLSRGTNITNERRSTTRYTADVTYMFNPTAVQRALRAAQIAFSQAQAKPILVIPMSPGVSHGPWASALMSPAFRDSQVPFTLLEPEDDAALAALNFDAAGWNDVSAVAIKNHVSEVALVQAVYAGGKMTVNVRRLGAGQQPAKTSVDVPVLQTVGTTYPVAAQAAVHAIEDMWKTRSAIDFTQRGRLTADVRIASLAQWGEIQISLAAVGNVTSVNVAAMDMGYARVNLTYQGGLDQLREAFAGAGLTLANHGGQWTLAKAQ